jgi:hypothetical protein
MTPQNIADSAPTSFTSLKGRTECKFVEEEVLSNFFTKGSGSGSGSVFSFKDKDFNEKNKYGFELNIKHNGKEYTVPFSESQTEGPSVNYLVDIMTCSQAEVPLQNPKKSSTLKIGEVLSDVNMNDGKIPFDLKRIGDHEQLRAAVAAEAGGELSPIIFCTIDILCSLFARLKKQRCIFHVGEKLVLYRFPQTINTNPVSIELYRAKRTVENLTKYNILLQAKQQLDDQLDHITKSIVFGIFIAKTNRNNRAEYIVTCLIIIRLLDICKSLYALTNSFTQLNIPTSIDHTKAFEFLSEFIKNPGEATTTTPAIDVRYKDSNGNEASVISIINSVKFDINALYEKFKTLNLTSNELKILMNQKTGQLNLKKNIMDEQNIFLKKGSYSLFNLNMESFSKLYDNLTILHGIKNARSARAQQTSIHDKLVSLGYYDNVYNICNDMLDPILSEQLRNMLTLSDNNDTLYSYFFGVDVQNEISRQLQTLISRQLQTLISSMISPITVILDSYTSSLGIDSISTLLSYDNLYRRVVSVRGGSIPKIIGGIGNPRQQYRDLSDLLREISGRAAAFVESLISNHNTPQQSIIDPHSLLNFIKENEKISKNSVKLYDELNFIWESNIFLIRNTGDIVYSTYKTNSVPETVLTFILSGLYSKDTIVNSVNSIIDHPYRYGLVGMNDATNIITKLTTDFGFSWESIVLLLLTLIDNIMNHPWTSLFEIKKFPRNDFDTEKEWNQVKGCIDVLLMYIKDNKPPIYKVMVLFDNGKKKIKTVKKKIDLQETRTKRQASVLRERRTNTQDTIRARRRRLLHLIGGTRYKRKNKRITQKLSMNKKYNKTSKKNKRPHRKTQRRRN